eukprot:156543-Prymnesium_polylepis.1
MVNAGEKKVKRQADKRQLTVLASSTPSGLLKSQAVWKLEGQDACQLAVPGHGHFCRAMIMIGATTVMNGCKRSSPTACFTLMASAAAGMS